LRPFGRALLLLTLFLVAGFAWFIGTLPRQLEALPAGTTDAVVVVTGGSARFAAGLQLLQEKRAAKLFVSGVDRTVGLTELLRQAPRSDGVTEYVQCCIVLGYEAGDTVGNAAETAAWMRNQGFRSLRLVSSNYHIRRAVLEFRMAMPDLSILTYPVEPSHVSGAPWWHANGTPGLMLSEYAKYLVTAARYAAFEARRAVAGGTAS
jgi:uncharacterized SAM-binding protein YcdF (DUF218 family)